MKAKQKISWDVFASQEITCLWCGRQDSNLHTEASDPKSDVSANFTTPAYYAGGLSDKK